MKNISIILICFFALASNILKAQCKYTLQPGEEGIDAGAKKSFCWNEPNACDIHNFGNKEYLYTTAWTHNGYDKDWRSFLKFDLSNLQFNGCNVLEAKLQLHHSGYPDDHCGTNTNWHPCHPNDFEIKRVIEPWFEYHINWNNQPDISEDTISTDYVYIGDSSIYTYHTYKIDITDMVNFWLSNPDSNFGFRTSLAQEFIHYKTLYFASSDNSDPTKRPKLELTLDCSNNSSCKNLITGKIFDDRDQSCSENIGDATLEDWLVKIEPGPTYATTDKFGFFSAYIDSGNYTITPILKNTEIWNSDCTPSYSLNVNSSDTSINNLNFPIQAESYCAELSVDIGVNRMRKCHNEWFKVEYCNDGNLEEDSVYINVFFDEYIHFISATHPYTFNSDSSLRFFIDSLDAYECGYFNIETLIDCDVDFGITQCASAEIYPRNNCVPIDSTWDKSSVQVNGDCLGDSNVCFSIHNTGDVGDGDMEGTSNWYLFEDGILIQSGNFQLNGQESIDLCFSANSHTLQLKADQRPGHPGNSKPNDIIEVCGSDPSVEIVSATSFEEDDTDKHTEIICQVIRASYDPNEKVSIPNGIKEEKYINPNTLMEYTIHFQNKGNDTAFLVVIRDTLPNELIPETVISGISSDNYNFRLIGKNILEWRFENIILVDSTTNEEESKGYVKFKINQKNDLSHGTIIQNRAGIYFDYNDPIITDYEFNTIWDTLINNEEDLSIIDKNNFYVAVFPNPTLNTINFNFADKEQYSIQLFNSLGKNVLTNATNKRFNKFDISTFSDGIYIYTITNKLGEQSFGKFVKK